ncbi:MAG TPA: hypothetical protein VKH44_00605, partial [Pirellulaceae bacterium]|nr:hypothetical protein [Pirellulaceae bacterium]
AKKKAIFEGNLHSVYTDVVDSNRQPIGVKLRLPKIFDGSSKADFQDTGKMLAKAGVAAPAGVPSASVYLLTRVLDGPAGEKLTCSVGLSAMPKAANLKPELMQDMLAKGVSAAFPGAAMSDVSVQTPGGQPLVLKRLRAEKSLPGGKGGAKLESRMDQYFVDAGNHMVIITWSIPKSQAAQLDEAIEASMGSLEITAPPPSAAPAGKATPAAPAGKAAPGCL